VILIIFYNIFHLKIHENNIFYFLKKLFLILTHQTIQKYLKQIISCKNAFVKYGFYHKNEH